MRSVTDGLMGIWMVSWIPRLGMLLPVIFCYHLLPSSVPGSRRASIESSPIKKTDINKHTNRAPFAELIKTPSRTQTSKKTRATTQAVKDRSQKIKGVNAKLGLSPVTVTTSKTSLSVCSHFIILRKQVLKF